MFPSSKRKRTLVFLGISALLSIGIVIIFLRVNSDPTAEVSYWPPLTMVYEVNGPVYNGVQIREVHRLEYRSITEWTDTVIESDSIESRAMGTVNTVGSFERLNGTKFESYDSITDDLHVQYEEGGILVPSGFLVPIHISELKKVHDLIPTTTASKVCYRDDCEQDAGGLAYTSPGGMEWIIANESRWGIPLKAGDVFFVREVRIDSTKE